MSGTWVCAPINTLGAESLLGVPGGSVTRLRSQLIAWEFSASYVTALGEGSGSLHLVPPDFTLFTFSLC